MLNVQKRLASQILKCGRNRVKFEPDSIDDIKEAITKADVRFLINSGAISKKRLLNTSNFSAAGRKKQKSKGRQKGHGSRKGKKTARTNPKMEWMNKIRKQRGFIKSLRDRGMIASAIYHELYMKSKGGFFRSVRHLKLYAKEKSLMKNE